jgi:hypothetical protein
VRVKGIPAFGRRASDSFDGGWSTLERKAMDRAFCEKVEAVLAGAEQCVTSVSTANGTRHPVRYSPDSPPLP